MTNQNCTTSLADKKADPSRNSGSNTGERNPNGTFSRGNSGKPQGARHKATKAALELLDGSAESLTQKAVDLALTGDTTALRLCLERIVPPRKDTYTVFELPKMKSAADAANAAAGIVEAVALGEIIPLEAIAVMGLVDSYRRALELTELEARLQALENSNGA